MSRPMADENRASDADMPRCRFVRSGHIQPAISGLTACQIAARRRIWFVRARPSPVRQSAPRSVAAFRSRLQRQQQAADRHHRGAEPENLGFAHSLLVLTADMEAVAVPLQSAARHSLTISS